MDWNSLKMNQRFAFVAPIYQREIIVADLRLSDDDPKEEPEITETRWTQWRPRGDVDPSDVPNPLYYGLELLSKRQTVSASRTSGTAQRSSRQVTGLLLDITGAPTKMDTGDVWLPDEYISDLWTVKEAEITRVKETERLRRESAVREGEAKEVIREAMIKMGLRGIANNVSIHQPYRSEAISEEDYFLELEKFGFYLSQAADLLVAMEGKFPTIDERA